MQDDKANWSGMRPESTVTLDRVRGIVEHVFPAGRIASVESMAGGLTNSCFRIQLEGTSQPLVLKIYERDPSAGEREAALFRRVGSTVPVPEILHLETPDSAGRAAFMVMTYIEGTTLRALKASRDEAAIAEAAFSVGRTLAAIGRHRFSAPGWLTGELEVGGAFVDGPSPVLGFIVSCLASPLLRGRLGERLTDRVHGFAEAWAPRLAVVERESCLVHGDFNAANLHVSQRRGRWEVTGVLDWEFAFSGSSLFDLGNLLRYERVGRPVLEPHVSAGFLDGGGRLPDDWGDVVRAVDITALCELLSRELLPDEIVSEVVGLVCATLEHRDPA